MNETKTPCSAKATQGTQPQTAAHGQNVRVRLRRMGETKYGDKFWTFRDFTVTKKHWVCPVACDTYLIDRNGKRLWPKEGTETLRDARELIAEEINK